jgi:hypothetical protein
LRALAIRSVAAVLGLNTSKMMTGSEPIVLAFSPVVQVTNPSG